MRAKNLKYYLGLNYDIIIRKIEEEGQVVFHAFTRELNPDAFYGVGNTPEAAIESFEDVKKELFQLYLSEGIPIPEPEKEEEELPSGKFLLRTSPKTHKRLIDLAIKNKQSLNSYINTILIEHCMNKDMLELARKELNNIVSKYEPKYKLFELVDNQGKFVADKYGEVA